MLMNILIPVAILSALGFGLAIVLGYSADKFKVEKNPLIDELLFVLPGVNCGACGYAGCENYAVNIANSGASLTLCAVGGPPVAEKIGDIMGVQVSTVDVMVAYVKCNGDCNKAKDMYEYHGLMDCVSASALPGGGAKACSYGCLGLGTCVKVCDFDAIVIKDGIAVIDENKCTSCGACIKACPKNIIESVPINSRVRVACNSYDSARDVMQNCAVGCIACKKCENTCQFDAIHVNNNLAKIDYSKCTQCNACVEVCPKVTIENILMINKAKRDKTA